MIVTEYMVGGSLADLFRGASSAARGNTGGPRRVCGGATGHPTGPSVSACAGQGLLGPAPCAVCSWGPHLHSAVPFLLRLHASLLSSYSPPAASPCGLRAPPHTRTHTQASASPACGAPSSWRWTWRGGWRTYTTAARRCARHGGGGAQREPRVYLAVSSCVGGCGWLCGWLWVAVVSVKHKGAVGVCLGRGSWEGGTESLRRGGG